MQCHTLLIETALERSAAYNDGAKAIDMRIFSGAGGLLGGILLGFVFESEQAFIAGASAGAIAGRIIAWHKWRKV